MQDRWSGEWHIVNTSTRQTLESHERQATAIYFCEVVNEHEEKNGRPRVYQVEQHPRNWRGGLEL